MLNHLYNQLHYFTNYISINIKSESIMEGNNTNREIENRKRRNLLTLFFIVLFYGFGEGTFFIVYQPFLLDITGSIFLTGVLITVFSIVQFLPAPFTGKISDKIGRKKMMLIDTPTRILGLFLLTVSNNVVLVTIGLICFFLAGVIGMSSFQILLSESSNDSKKGLMVGLIFFALFAGGIVGKFFIIVNKGFDARFYFFLLSYFFQQRN
ncbi:MAG: MFS transporter [Candidatus Lokiarchaeota archaeon]|nr:MFS transporter [Candidatus Lokiarchaeota archaeon]